VCGFGTGLQDLLRAILLAPPNQFGFHELLISQTIAAWQHMIACRFD